MEPDIKWLDDPETFRVGMLPATVIIDFIGPPMKSETMIAALFRA